MTLFGVGLLSILKIIGAWYASGLALFVLAGTISWVWEDEVITVKDLLMLLLVAGLGPIVLIAPLVDKLAERSDYTVIIRRSQLVKSIKAQRMRLKILWSKVTPRGQRRTLLYNQTYGRWRILWLEDGSSSQLLCYDTARSMAQAALSCPTRLYYTVFKVNTDDADKPAGFTTAWYDSSGRRLKTLTAASDVSVSEDEEKAASTVQRIC